MTLPSSSSPSTDLVDGPASLGGEGVAIVVNAAAGSSDDPSDEHCADLLGAEIITVGDDETLDDALTRADGAKILGIVGGDGSINAAAAHALATDRPLAVFPGGTLNHFARDLGTNEAADTIAALHDGALVTVDVGDIDGKPFLNTASFGSYADFVDEREKLEGRIGKWAASLIAAAKVLRHAEPVRVEIDGIRRNIWMIFIGNCEYQPPGLVPSSRSRLDDGLLDVRYVDCAPRSRLRLLRALATGRLAHTKVFRRTLVQSLDIHSLDGPLRLARDGETFDGDADVRVSKHPGALAVYARRD